MNKQLLIGFLGSDPDTKYTASGTAVCEFRMATSESWTDKGGQKKEETEWHRVVVWGKLAEICGKYLSKGRQVYVEGKTRHRSFDDKDGNKRYITEVIASSVEFLGGGKGSSQRDDRGPSSGHGFDVTGDDMPF